MESLHSSRLVSNALHDNGKETDEASQDATRPGGVECLVMRAGQCRSKAVSSNDTSRHHGVHLALHAQRDFNA